MHQHDILPTTCENLLKSCKKAWSNTEGGNVYAKNNINSMIDTFDIRSDSAWLLRSSRTEDDLRPLSNGKAVLKIRTDYYGGSICDYVLKKQHLTTMQVLDQFMI